MARQISNYVFKRNMQYPWEEWLNGKFWEVVRGEDFKVKPYSFVNALKQASAKRGLTVQYEVSGDTVIFQAINIKEK